MGELIYVNFIPPYRGRIDEEFSDSEEDDEEEDLLSFNKPNDAKELI